MFKTSEEPGLNSKLPYHRDYKKRDKRIAAGVKKLHTWTLKEPVMGMVEESRRWYMCLLCGYIDSALSPKTPDAREPFCTT